MGLAEWGVVAVGDVGGLGFEGEVAGLPAVDEVRGLATVLLGDADGEFEGVLLGRGRGGRDVEGLAEADRSTLEGGALGADGGGLRLGEGAEGGRGIDGHCREASVRQVRCQSTASYGRRVRVPPQYVDPLEWAPAFATRGEGAGARQHRAAGTRSSWRIALEQSRNAGGRVTVQSDTLRKGWALALIAQARFVPDFGFPNTQPPHPVVSPVPPHPWSPSI